MNSLIIQNENSKQKMNSKDMVKTLKIYILKQREKKKQGNYMEFKLGCQLRECHVQSLFSLKFTEFNIHCV